MILYKLPLSISLRLIVFPPVMLLLKAQHLPNLPIRQRRLKLLHRSRNRRIRLPLLQELLNRLLSRTRTIRRIKYLKPQPGLLNPQITNLAQVPRVNIRPRVPPPRLRLVHMSREIRRVFVGLDDIADDQGVDIVTVAAGESAGCALTTEFGQRVGVHRVAVVGCFV